MFKLFFVILSILPIIFGDSPFHQCRLTNRPLPRAVFFGGRESPCRSEPCPVFRSVGSGTTYIDFTTTRQITGLRPELRARVIGITVDHQLPNSMMTNPWSYLIGGSNPLPAGSSVTFNLTVPVEPSTPLVTSVNIFTLWDQNNQAIFCYEIESVVRP
jgi:ML domain